MTDMPRPTMPLTPAHSTEFTGAEKTYLPSDEAAIKLPPPALTQSTDHRGSTVHRPIQPAGGGAAYSLPPPPTRSRKIIQMTPKSAPLEDPDFVDKQPSKSGARNLKSNGKAPAANKRQNNNTTAAGKKIARKTAHSVIERRRRSKMNDEFSTLKDMIPACKGQDMHKLAILQASVDYLRYLQTCITDLKAANNALSTPMIQARAPKLRADSLDDNLSNDEDDESDGDGDNGSPLEPEDEIMKDAEASPSNRQTTHSRRERYNITEFDHEHAGKAALLPSPAFEAKNDRPYSQHSWSARSLGSANTSPTLIANSEQDEEATAALMMLTHDRRHLTSQENGRRGLSVKDLLTH